MASSSPSIEVLIEPVEESVQHNSDLELSKERKLLLLAKKKVNDLNSKVIAQESQLHALITRLNALNEKNIKLMELAEKQNDILQQSQTGTGKFAHCENTFSPKKPFDVLFRCQYDSICFDLIKQDNSIIWIEENVLLELSDDSNFSLPDLKLDINSFLRNMILPNDEQQKLRELEIKLIELESENKRKSFEINLLQENQIRLSQTFRNRQDIVEENEYFKKKIIEVATLNKALMSEIKLKSIELEKINSSIAANVVKSSIEVDVTSTSNDEILRDLKFDFLSCLKFLHDHLVHAHNLKAYKEIDFAVAKTDDISLEDINKARNSVIKLITQVTKKKG